jgi:hypothetical protein
MAEGSGPLLSVVVAIVSDTTRPADARHLEESLEALERQAGAPPMEIVVPYLPSTAGIARLRELHPAVRFIEAAGLAIPTGINSREHHDELRALGLAAARGEILALIEDHGLPSESWAARLTEALAPRADRSYVPAGAGGAIENGVDRLLNWAVYFCDFLRYQNPLPEGEAPAVSDANVAYPRAVLESIGPGWRQVFQEWAVTQALRERGEKLVFAPAAVLYQNRRGLELGDSVRERFVWGRSYAVTRARHAPASRRVIWAICCPALPLLLLARLSAQATAKRRTLPAFLKAFPLTALLVTAWSCGELAGYITGRAAAQTHGEPVKAHRSGAAS